MKVSLFLPNFHSFEFHELDPPLKVVVVSGIWGGEWGKSKVYHFNDG